MEFHHQPNFSLHSCSHSGISESSEHNGLPCSIVVSFLLAWVSSGCPDPSSTKLDTGTGEVSLTVASSRSRTGISLTVGEEDEDEEDDEEWLSCFIGVLKADEDPEDELDKPGTTIGTKFSVLQGIRIPAFNEMWFLTIDPFVRIPVFIAKLSKRQYCWRVFEDFHSQECIQFFDIHNCLFMRLHFSTGGYDYRRTARLRQSIFFSITQVLFADHVHWRSGVDNKFSFLRFRSWCKAGTYFPKVRRILLFHAPLIFNTLLASFHAASRAPCSCH